MPEEGETVKVSYVGTLDDGTVFDKSSEPFEFKVGEGSVIQGFDEAVKGLGLDEEKDVVIEPEDAYGNRDPMKIKELPRDRLPADIEIGAVLMLSLPTGERISAKVTDIGNENLTIDLNHPLAGRRLNFKIRLLSVTRDS